jgi:hypothetical protein
MSALNSVTAQNTFLALCFILALWSDTAVLGKLDPCSAKSLANAPQYSKLGLLVTAFKPPNRAPMNLRAVGEFLDRHCRHGARRPQLPVCHSHIRLFLRLRIDVVLFAGRTA